MVRIRLNNRKSQVCPPPLVSEGREPHLGAQQSPWPDWVGQMPSSPLPLLPERHSCLPLLISPASLLCPQDPRGLEGLRRWAYQPGSSVGSLGPSGLCDCPPLFLEGPSHLPLLISPASGALILSGLHFSSPLSPPTSLLVHLGVPPISWGVRVPTSSQQVP